jgi:hypothetical protein
MGMNDDAIIIGEPKKKVFQLVSLYGQFLKTLAIGGYYVIADGFSRRKGQSQSILLRAIDAIFFAFTWLLMVPLGFLVYGTNMAPVYALVSCHLIPPKLVKRLAAPLMKEPALWPLAYTLIASTAVEITFWALYFTYPEHRAVILGLHLVACCSQMLFWFIMAHKSVHKLGLFKSPILNFYHHFILGAFYGFPGDTFAYHVFNHHVENNGPKDITYIMHYRRDRLDDFFRFFWTFIGVSTIAPLVYYHRTGRRVPFIRDATSLALNALVFGLVAFFVGPLEAAILILVPATAGAFVTAIHTWAEHGFVTPGQHENLAACTSTWTLSNPPDLLAHVPKRLLPYFLVHIDEKAHMAHHARPTKIPLPLEPSSTPEHTFVDNPQWLGGDRNWAAFHMMRRDFATLARYLQFDPAMSEDERIAEVATMVRAGPDTPAQAATPKKIPEMQLADAI